jgi:pimeloyl-ACP methyl ester carboxylesterase
MNFNFAALSASPRLIPGLGRPVPKRQPRSVVRQCLELAVLYAGIYIALSPLVAMPLYNLLLFPADSKDYSSVIATPIKQLHDQLGVHMREMFFSTPDGHKLNALYFVRPGATKLLLVSHGNGGNVAHSVGLAAALLCCNANVFVYDYEGYGKSQGKPGIRAAVRDGIAAYDCVTSQLGFQRKDIILYGASLGTGVTLQISRTRPASAIVLQSGFSTLVNVGREALPWLWLYPDSWFDNLDNLNVLAQPHAPLLILHGDADVTCRVHHAVDLYKRALAPKQLVILPNCGHIFGIDQPGMMEFLKAIKRFMNSTKYLA